uniref:Uncharacterized protein n=1 Tax=Amphimedon queenslandica TaxID=400682 RepID=A0A1X7UTA0_AMPQE
MDERVFIS